jgi:hypothetical protein
MRTFKSMPWAPEKIRGQLACAFPVALNGKKGTNDPFTHSHLSSKFQLCSFQVKNKTLIRELI